MMLVGAECVSKNNVGTAKENLKHKQFDVEPTRYNMGKLRGSG